METTRMEPAIRKLTLTLFGAFEARCGGASLPDLQKRDGERLLALLALHNGRPVKTEVLAQTLWRESGSLDSLHQAASHLRRALGENGHRLQSLKGTLMLDVSGVQVDVNEFDEAIGSGDINSLKKAIGLYRRGALLE